MIDCHSAVHPGNDCLAVLFFVCALCWIPRDFYFFIRVHLLLILMLVVPREIFLCGLGGM